MNQAKRDRVVLYVRVSMVDLRIENQLDPLLRYCANQDFEVVGRFQDVLTGTNDRRPGLKAAIAALKKGEADLLVTFSVDRLARNLRDLVRLVDEIKAMGRGLIVMRENLDLRSENPQGRLFLHVFGAFAEFEASLIRERTRNALAVARLRGQRLGRPPKLNPEIEDQIVALRTQGVAVREIARRMTGISRALIQSVLKRHAKKMGGGIEK